jgi:DNA modification methylase
MAKQWVIQRSLDNRYYISPEQWTIDIRSARRYDDTHDIGIVLAAGWRTLILPECFANDTRVEDNTEKEAVNHPKHYNDHPSGVECISIVEHMSFNVGNAIEYLWRAGLKDATIQDLEKAKWYVEREIGRLNGTNGVNPILEAAKMV